jgi:hypothetical protein
MALDHDQLTSILGTARADVAAGREPDMKALEARIRSAGGGRPELQQLERVLTVHRARARLAAPPAAPPAQRTAPLRPRGRAAFRAQPTITGNMEVRRAPSPHGVELAWETTAAVTGWEVRVSERPDARSEYAVRETHDLAGSATRFELALGELPRRVHLLGRANDGRLVRRAIVSALTRENWNDRWQRRASAS